MGGGVLNHGFHGLTRMPELETGNFAPREIRRPQRGEGVEGDAEVWPTEGKEGLEFLTADKTLITEVGMEQVLNSRCPRVAYGRTGILNP